MSVELGALRFAIESDLKGLRGDVQEVNKITQSMERRFAQTQRAAATLFAGVFSAQAAQNIVGQADAYAMLERRVETATRATGDFVAVNDQLTQVARQNFAALQSTVSLFQNVKRGADELGASTPQIIEFIDLVQKLGRIGGATAEAQQFGTTQLSQALASGQLRGDELRSIMENLPELANAIARGMGVSAGKMRELAFEGKVTSKDVFESILGQSERINRQIEKFSPAISEAGQRAQTDLGLALKDLFQETGAAAKLPELILKISDNMETLVKVGATAGTVIASVFAARGANALVGQLSQTAGSMIATSNAAKALAVSEIEERRAAVALNIEKQRELLILAQATKGKAALINIERAMELQQVRSLTLQRRLNEAIAGQTIVQRAARTSTLALAAAQRVGARALALIGGPAGAALLAAEAIFFMTRRAREMREEVSQASPEMERFIKSLEGIDGVNSQFEAVNSKLAETERQLAELNAQREALLKPAEAPIVFISDDPGNGSLQMPTSVAGLVDNQDELTKVTGDIAALEKEIVRLKELQLDEANAIKRATSGTLEDIDKIAIGLSRHLNEQRLILAGRENEIPLLREQLKLQDQLDAAVKGKKISEEDAQAALERTLPIISMIVAESEKVTAEIEAQKKAQSDLNDLQADALGIVGRFSSDIERAAADQQVLNDAMAAGLIDLDQWLRGTEGIAQALEKDQEKARTLSDTIRQLADDFRAVQLADSGDRIGAEMSRILAGMQDEGISYTDAEADRLRILLEQIDAYERQHAVVSKLRQQADDLAQNLAGALAQAVIAGEDFEAQVKNIIKQTIILIAQQLILASVAALVAALTGGTSAIGGAFATTLTNGFTAGIQSANGKNRISTQDVETANAVNSRSVNAGLTIVNVSTKQQLLEAMASNEGQALIVNTITSNKNRAGAVRSELMRG